MKVEITEIRKKVIEVVDDENIEENILEKYNQLTDSDYSPMDTQMFYKVLPKTPQQLGVKYDRKQLTKYIIKRAYDNFSAISCMQLSVILYMLYEYYYTKSNIKLFEAEFISYQPYPKEKNTYWDYCFYAANKITPSTIDKITINISTTDKNIIDRFIKEYCEINLYDIHEKLFNTLYERMIRAGLVSEEIKFEAS